MKGSPFSEEQINRDLAGGRGGEKTPELYQRHGISSATFYTYGRHPRGNKVSGPGLAVSIANTYSASPSEGAPKWDIRSHPPRQVVGLERHYKSQGLSVPVRSVSPFSDPSSDLAQPSCSGAVRLATGQHGPGYPCVLVGDHNGGTTT